MEKDKNRARGYVWASLGSLAIAEDLLPVDHKNLQQLSDIVQRVSWLYKQLDEA